MQDHCHGRILKDQRELQQDWCIFWMWIILINIIGQTIIHSWREILRTNKIIIGKRNYCNNKHDKILPFLNFEQQITNNFQTNLLSITFKRLFEEKERIITPFSFTNKKKKRERLSLNIHLSRYPFKKPSATLHYFTKHHEPP